MNNKGFALTSMIYMLIVLFLMILLLVLSNLASRKVILDKIKYDVKNKLEQGISVNSMELPYQNQSTGVYYETLDLAISSSETNDTIKVMKNTTDQSEINIIEQEVNLDLNGKEIVLGNSVINKGILNIYSSIDGGTINSQDTYAIKNSTSETNPILNISNCTIEGNIGIYNEGEGTVTINNGNITGQNGSSIMNLSTGTINVMGESVITSVTSSAINNSNKNIGIINISGNSTITGKTTGIIGANGIVTVNGGTIIGTGTDGINITTYNNISGSVTVTSGTISGGRIGIIAASGTAEITIGQDDGNVDTNSPLIISTNTSTATGHGNGVYLEGKSGSAILNFYDGTIKGSTNAIRLSGSAATQNLPSNNLYSVESGTEVIDGVTYKTAKLKLN